MKRISLVLMVIITICLIMPLQSLAAGTKTITGTVTRIYGNQITFSTTSAAKYSVDSGSAQLLRKNGAAMQFSEILIGDKIEVKGTLWGDNSISATSIRNLSLYTHTGTFSGKISSINPAESSFIMDSKTYGSQTIHANNYTVYTKNGSSSTFNNLMLGMTAKVKGMWDRSNSNIAATTVNGTYKLINIYFTGTLQAKNGQAFTVIGNGNVIYGVDLAGTILQSKNGKTMSLGEYNLGDSLRVWGKHLSGSVAVIGTQIKDSSVTK